MEITPVPGPLTAPAPTACASCVFGAYSSRVLSFTSSYIEHITVSVTPHIYVYNNGSRSTSFESNTLTKSSIVGGIAGSNTTKTFAKKNDITWTVGGATLTYPTKYVQYLGFKGAPAATDDGETCAEETEASEISLPATTDAASFIYALPANATALPLPNQLLQYLGGLDDLVDQFDGASLSGCAPLDGSAHGAGNVSSPHYNGGNTSIAGPSVTSYMTHPLGTGDLTRSLSGSTSSSGIWSPSSMKPTGYAAGSGSMSTTLSASTHASISGTGSGSSSIKPDAYTTSSASISRSSSSWSAQEPSHSSSSSGRFSILPHPYLNTTSSQGSTSSTIIDTTTRSDGASITTAPSETSVVVPSTSRTFTITNPGGVFFPDPVDNGEQLPTSTAALTTPVNPPKGEGNGPGGNSPEDVPPDDDDDEGLPPAPVQSLTTQVTHQVPSQPALETSNEGENDHTTAFVIEPITGSALITYQSEPSKIKTSDTSRETTNGVSPGDAYVGVVDATPTPDPDVSNLLNQIDTIANGGQDSINSDTSASDPAGSNGGDSQAAPGNDAPSNVDSGQSQGSSNGPSSGQTSGNSEGSSGSSGQGSSDGQGIDLIDAINSVANQQGGNDGAADFQPTATPANDPAPAPIYSGENTVLTAQPGGAVVVGDQTVAPGQSITVGSGPSTTVIGLETNGASTNLVVAGSTFEASPGNSAITAQSNGAVVFEGSTVQPGQSVTIGSGPSATVVALQTAGSATNLVVGGSTVQVVPQGGAITAAPEAVTGVSSMALITTNGQTITAIQSGSSLILQSGGSTTTVAADEAATFAGETILAVPTEDAVFVNGNITPLTAAEGVEGASQAVITANSQTFTAIDAGNSVLLVDGSVTKTLEDGSSVVFNGQTISAQESRMAVVINGHTSSLTSAIALATGQAVITADGETFSVLDLPGYVVLRDGSTSMTIRDGATATFDGQVITALANGDAVVVDGQTMSMTDPVALTTAQAVITAGGNTFTAIDMDGYVILQDGTSSTTVKDGQTAVFDSQTIRALASGDAVVVNGRTSTFTSVEATPTDEVNQYIDKGLGGSEATSSETVGAASSQPTDSPEGNSASVMSTSWAGLALAGLLGVVAML